jgi:hypothetical protein
MKLITAWFLLSLCIGASGQVISKSKLSKTSTAFYTIRDSILRLTDKKVLISITPCEGVAEFCLAKDSLRWTGYYIKNLDEEGMSYKRVLIGSGEETKPMKTAIMVFDADSLYAQLVALKIYTIKQLSVDAIRNTISKHTKQEYRIIASSHDCDMTIQLYGSQQKTIAYARSSFVDNPETYSIPSIKICHRIEVLLRKATNGYSI